MKFKKRLIAASIIAIIFPLNQAKAEHADSVKQLLILENAKTSLYETVMKKESTDIIVIEAEVDQKESFLSLKEESIVYKLVTVNKEQKRIKYFFDPVTGSEIDSKILTNWNPFDTDKILPSLKITMAEAIELSQNQFNGKAYKAELEKEDEINFYEIHLVTDTGIKKAIVHSITGRVIQQSRISHDHDKR